MKTLIAILILLSFLQTTLIPLNLVLVFLILRSYIRPEDTNLYMAFFFGIFVALLSHDNLGLYSVIFLCLVYLTHLLSRAPISKNFLSIIPLVGICSLIFELITTIPFDRTPELWPTIGWDIAVALPMYFAVKFWEERFIVKPQIRLKVK